MRRKKYSPNCIRNSRRLSHVTRRRTGCRRAHERNRRGINGDQGALKLTNDIKRAGETHREASKELRDQDRRLTWLEAQWETAIALRRQLKQIE